MQNIINVYESRGLIISIVRRDSVFLCLIDSILLSVFVVAAKGEHVPKIERSIRTVKECARSIICGLPYLRYPPLMIRSLLVLVVRILNLFPSSAAPLSPLSLVTGTHLPFIKEFCVEFGSYVQAHNSSTISNNMNPRSLGADALYPANIHRGWYFLPLLPATKSSDTNGLNVTLQMILSLGYMNLQSKPLQAVHLCWNPFHNMVTAKEHLYRNLNLNLY